jgi:hypothetical protein
MIDLTGRFHNETVERTDNLDTTPEAHQRWVALLRTKSPEWKFARMMEMNQRLRDLYPDKVKKAILDSMRRKP